MSANNALYRVTQRVKGRIIPTILNKTANYTVKADELLYGAVLANSGASGAVVFALPAAQPGMRLTATVIANQNLTLDLLTGDTIRTLATSGQTFSASAAGATLQLVCVVPNVWESVGAPDGTWTAAA
jgi:hypothetical protein